MLDQDVKRGEQQPTIAFVGCVVPDEAEYHTCAFSRAGNMFQLNLIHGLEQIGYPISAVISPIAIPVYPSGKRLFISSCRYRLSQHMQVRTLAFLNVPLLKQIGIGMAAFGRILAWGWKFRKTRRKVILAYNLSVPPGVFLQAAAWLIRAKVVALLYDIGLPGVIVKDTLLNRISYRMECWSIARLDGVITATDAIVRDFQITVPHIRLEGGFDENIRPKPRATSTHSQFIIASVGSLNRTNGIDLLLEAFRLLKGNQYRLRVAGRGDLAELVQAAALRDPRIEYLGYISFDETLKVYEGADLLINARLSKNLDTAYYFPSKLMEYMASGCPVLSTCAADIEKEYSRVVYLLKEETAATMAAEIERIEALGQNARIEKGRQGQFYILANKSWTAQSRRVVELIESLY